MSRVPSLSSPFLLGFDEIERALDRVAKAADGYPPYNIERIACQNGQPGRFPCGWFPRIPRYGEPKRRSDFWCWESTPTDLSVT